MDYPAETKVRVFVEGLEKPFNITCTHWTSNKDFETLTFFNESNRVFVVPIGKLLCFEIL